VYSVEFIEYPLGLSSGEDILVSELDQGRHPPLVDPVVAALADPALSRCSRVSRDALEDAKNGYTEGLESQLRTPPRGCLLMMARPECAEVKVCATADPGRCTARYSERGRPAFPHCWTFRVEGPGTEEQRSYARDLVDSVVDAWRSGRVVVIAVP
jgi:hypothetical protein